MILPTSICILLSLSINPIFIDAAFRYENRIISCSVKDNGEDSCVLTAPDTKLKNLDLNVECRRELMENAQKSKNDSNMRLACPIRCPKDYEVHVLQKIPSTNKKCIKYYTYGKYQGDEEWFVWMVEPCITTISTHCRYPEN